MAGSDKIAAIISARAALPFPSVPKMLKINSNQGLIRERFPARFRSSL
jgi:hypothetical protein